MDKSCLAKKDLGFGFDLGEADQGSVCSGRPDVNTDSVLYLSASKFLCPVGFRMCWKRDVAQIRVGCFWGFLTATGLKFIINICHPILMCRELNLPFVVCMQTEVVLCHAPQNSAAECGKAACREVCLKVLVYL